MELISLVCILFSDPQAYGNFHFAQYITCGDKKFLCHKGHKFYKNSESKNVFDANQKIYWRCKGYQRFACLVRATSQIMSGYEMVKFKGNHTHPPEVTDGFL